VAMDGLLARRKEVYMYRMLHRCSWAKVAEACGYGTGRGAQEAAKIYATSSGLPWPLVGMTKGGSIYYGRVHGLSWAKLSRIYDSDINSIQGCAYKWASRGGKAWPPKS